MSLSEIIDNGISIPWANFRMNNLTVEGTLTAPSIVPGPTISVNTIQPYSGTLTTFPNDVTINGTLTAEGISVGPTIAVNTINPYSGTLTTFPSNVTIDGTLTAPSIVPGPTIAVNTINPYSGTTTVIPQNLTVEGTLTAPSITPGPTISVNTINPYSGTLTTFPNDVTIDGTLTAPSITPGPTISVNTINPYSGTLTTFPDNVTIDGTLTANNFTFPPNASFTNITVTNQAYLNNITEQTPNGIIVNSNIRSQSTSWQIFPTGVIFTTNTVFCASLSASTTIQCTGNSTLNTLTASNATITGISTNTISSSSSLNITAYNGIGLSSASMNLNSSQQPIYIGDYGIQFINSNQSPLSKYEYTTINLSFTGCWSNNYDLTISKIGTIVTIQWPDMINTSNADGFITSTQALPIRFQSSSTKNFSIKGIFGPVSTKIMTLTISSGILQFSNDYGNFGYPTSVGPYSGCISYDTGNQN